MRVNPNPVPDLLSALDQTEQQINTDLYQVASGQTIRTPSDNPAAAAMLVRNAGESAEADQFQRSAAGLSGEMQNADSALSSVITVLQRAISLGVEGANGTINSAGRAALANEVQGIQSQLLSLANLSYQGNFVFAGTATQTQPYVLDASSPSGVRYVGNSGVNHVTVGDHLSVQTNLPGSQLLSTAGNDVFQAVQDLITSLQTGMNIDKAVEEISSAYQHINAQRVFYGNAGKQLSLQQNFLEARGIQLAQQQNDIAGTDLARVLSDLANAQTSREATLATIGRTQHNNLFDFLK